ncbi:MAG: hypothetical protein ACM3SQ_04125 [Betaproteobacteria bacterium]
MRGWATWAASIVVSASTLQAQASGPAAVLPSTPIAVTADTLRTETPEDEQQNRQQELRDWIKAYRKFRDWDDVWRNYVYPFGKRKQSPDPPEWLASACLNLDRINLFLEDDTFDKTHFVSTHQAPTALDPMQTGCLLLEEWQDDYATAQIRREIRTTRVYRDKPRPHTVIWELVNFDVMYSATSVGSPVRAPVGVHLGFPIGNRVRLFAAPGAILLCVEGFSNCRAAYDYGLGIRLFDFRMPGFDQPASLHLNLAKAWFLGAQGVSPQSGLDIAGFSIAFKRR